MKAFLFCLVSALVFEASAMGAQNFGPADPAASEGLRLFQRVVIDPGHGGRDPGAAGAAGTVEKELALQAALAVRDELMRRGLEVRMTRETDVFVPLDERAKLSNDWGADLFVSIHANASESRGLNGFEIYTLSEETDDTELARARAAGKGALAVILEDLRARENRRQSARAAQRIAARVARYVPVEARRLKSANFRVLKNAESPAVLVEIGYLTNLRDRSRLARSRYLQAMIGGIADGILLFKKEYEASDGFAR